MDGETVPPQPTSSTLFLDGAGEVSVSVHSGGMSIDPLDRDSIPACCMLRTFRRGIDDKIHYSDVYSVELIEPGSLSVPWDGKKLLRGGHNRMYRFVVRSVIRYDSSPSPWVLNEHTFGHKELSTCEAWVDHFNYYKRTELARPKRLLVFVHPLCGKGKGCKTWDMVAPLFSQANVQTKVTVTQRAGHAYDVVASLSDAEIRSFDGVVVVGGDGLFNEVLNGVLSSRHDGLYPPTPKEFSYVKQDARIQGCKYTGHENCMLPSDVMLPDDSIKIKHDDCEPLISTQSREMDAPVSTYNNEIFNGDKHHSVTFPNDWFRFGIIPAGSTDAIVLSTTGVRDPLTSALQIILGRKLSLDIAQVVRWKANPSSKVSPCIRYAASFAGYGFYGEVVRQSEKNRWMGPARYDYTGALVFLRHRSYEVQIAFLERESSSGAEADPRPSKSARKSCNKLVCRSNCAVCDGSTAFAHSANDNLASSDIVSNNLKWRWSKGRFLSVGAAVISCRNERAPYGLVADAHLSDGFLHLILIRDCPRPLYLWHLTRFSSKQSDPLNFSFVEHHKTLAFTFVAPHDESVWNLDGEIFQASEVSVQVCRGLINLFASGPEV